MIQEILKQIQGWFQFGADQAPEEETIASIESGVVFRGAKLWVLILAIFVASLGLNTNSTAVIIGAMLISPLMGPILGMGLSAGIYDFQLMKRAFKNYAIATIFSIATACIYFLLTPFEEVQSELLARTSPTIYDVLIALCGGLAGIIGLSSRYQRMGNVIPGVAIATALMPPLCTVGFGIATANWLYALGAFYLYLINTVFISLATYLGVSFIFKFRKRTVLNEQQNRKFRYILMSVGLFVILPSLYMTFLMVQRSIFDTNVHRFCKQELNMPGVHIVGSDTDYENRSVRLVLMGTELDSTQVKGLQDRLQYYGLEDTRLSVIQGGSSLDAEQIRSMMSTSHDKEITSRILAEEEQKRHLLEQQLQPHNALYELAPEVYAEIKVLYPEITSLTLAQGRTVVHGDSLLLDTTSTIAVCSSLKPIKERHKLQEWLAKRLGRTGIVLITDR